MSCLKETAHKLRGFGILAKFDISFKQLTVSQIVLK